MKLLWITVILVGIVSASYVPVSSRSLENSVELIKAMIPIDEIDRITMGCVDDPELIKLIDLLKSEVTQNAVDAFGSNTEIIEFFDWVESKNVDAVDFFNSILAMLGLKPIEDRKILSKRANCGGWSGLFEQIKQNVNIPELAELLKKLWIEDEEFGEMMDKIQGSEILVRSLLDYPAIKTLVIGLENHGVNIAEISYPIYKFFGWHITQ